jgi:hypothetical protein
MATGAFYYPTVPTGMSAGAGASVVSCDVTPQIAGITLNAVYYWKDTSDTGTHTITVYRTSDQSVVSSPGAFTGETASGWQTFTYGTPLAVPVGFTYRIAVSSPVSHVYGGSFGSAGVALNGASISGTTYYLSGATSGYPNSGFGGFQCVDALMGGLTGTQLKASQDLAETWVASAPALCVSQSTAEVWVQNQPPTDLRASQDLAEVWVTDSGPPTQLRVSQVLAEVWIPGPAPSQPLRISAQVI